MLLPDSRKEIIDNIYLYIINICMICKLMEKLLLLVWFNRKTIELESKLRGFSTRVVSIKILENIKNIILFVFSCINKHL